MKLIRQLDYLPPPEYRDNIDMRYRRKVRDGIRRLDMIVNYTNPDMSFGFHRLHWWVPTVDGVELAFCDTQREAKEVLRTALLPARQGRYS